MPKLKKTESNLFRAWYKGKQFYGKTEAEAKAKRDEYKYECEHGIEQQKPISVFDYAEIWLKTYKKNVTSKTYNNYASVIERMTAIIGDKLISAVTPNDIKRVWNNFAGCSQSLIDKGRFLYSAIFKSAIENGYCKQNPVDSPSVKPHKGTSGSHRMLTREEINLIKTVPHRCQAGTMIMLLAGLRRGEMLALEKSDVHDDRIFVTKAVRFEHNRPLITDTKTELSDRSLPLFAPLKPVFDVVDGYVLPDANGGLCSEQAFKRAWWSYMHVLSQVAGHKISFRPHDCRHTFVTTCRDKGVDIHTCMTWCGHADEKMILKIYDHVTEDRELRAAEILYGKNKRPKQLKNS